MSEAIRNMAAVLMAIALMVGLWTKHFAVQSAESEALSMSREGLNLLSSGSSDPGTVTQAVTLFSRAIERDPRDPLALFGLGWALQLQGKGDGARARYDQAIEQLYEVTKFSLFNRSFLKEQRGDLRGALYDVRAAHSIDPGFEAARVRETELSAKVVDSQQ